MRVLVTGAAGFIGTHLCAELRDAGHDVFAADKNDGDLTNAVQAHGLVRYARPEVCIHLAAQVGREFGEDDLIHTATSNAGMTSLIARACGDLGVRLMYASTSEVYGDRGGMIADEHDLYDFEQWWDPAIPHNLYGLSKRWGEEAARLYSPNGLTIMRFSMPYGPGLPAGRGRAALINFLYNALHGKPITVHVNSERSWCWIGDTVRAVRLLLEGNHAGAYNIGRDDNAISMRRVAEMACDLVGASHDLIIDVEPPANQTVVKRLSTSKIRAFGWKPEVEFAEGMERTLEWVKTLAPPLSVAA